MTDDYDTITDESDITVYKGKDFIKKGKLNKSKKVVVFDLDETLGSFVDLDILWQTVHENTIDKNLISFDNILDLYPEFLRPGIIKILKLVYNKRNNGECHKLYIYTNNQSQSYYVNMICDYFSNKVCKSNKLFDQIIYAFKINNNIIQIGRTSHSKKYTDFIKCSLLPKNIAVCFLDNTSFDDMKKKQVYYMQPAPYYHRLSPQEIINRVMKSKYKHLFKNKHEFNMIFNTKYNQIKHIIPSEYDYNNKSVTKKMIYHLNEFFLISKKRSKTKKKKILSNNFTRKINR
jgi:hypothetical protein